MDIQWDGSVFPGSLNDMCCHACLTFCASPKYSEMDGLHSSFLMLVHIRYTSRPMMAWLCLSGLFKISRPCADACLSAPLQNPTMKNHVLCPRRQSQKVMERVHVLWLFLSSNTRLLYQSAQKNHSSYTMFWNSFFPQILNSCASSLKTTVATVHDLRRSLLSKYPALSSLQNKACSRKCLLALSAQNLNCTDIQLPSHLHPPASHSTRRAMVGVVRV
jgi:hypothetical protein